MTFDYALNEISWENMMLYNSVLPSYLEDEAGEESADKDEVIKADDPKNRETVRKILFE